MLDEMGKFERDVEKRAQEITRKLFTPDILKESVKEVPEAELESAVRAKAQALGPLSETSEALDESVRRRQAEGKELLASIYGTDKFSPFTVHFAGIALDAARSGDFQKSKIAVEQLHRDIENMRSYKHGAPQEKPTE